VAEKLTIFISGTMRDLPTERERVAAAILEMGLGLDLNSEQQLGGGGFGLRFMRGRAERAVGGLRIESQPSHGPGS
jgi:signal transduction histidine kinase